MWERGSGDAAGAPLVSFRMREERERNGAGIEAFRCRRRSASPVPESLLSSPEPHPNHGTVTVIVALLEVWPVALSAVTDAWLGMLAG